jgi:RecG-like helicase
MSNIDFGVNNALSCGKKHHSASRPHVTATPIPRTLAMSLYGDLDISNDELP